MGKVATINLPYNLDVSGTAAAQVIVDGKLDDECQTFRWFVKRLADTAKKEVKPVLMNAADKEISPNLDAVIGALEKLGAGSGAAFHNEWHRQIRYQESQNYMPDGTVHGSAHEASLKVLLEKTKKEQIEKLKKRLSEAGKSSDVDAMTESY